MKITFKACRHLIFDKNKIDSRIKLRSADNRFVYWNRPEELLPDHNCVSDVQFCELRGRLNSKVSCLQDCGECELYKEIEYSIEVQDDK